MKRKFENLAVGDIIYLFTKDDVRKIRIIDIRETKYRYAYSDYYIESVDVLNDVTYRVLAPGNKSVYRDDSKEILYVIDPYFSIK